MHDFFVGGGAPRICGAPKAPRSNAPDDQLYSYLNVNKLLANNLDILSGIVCFYDQYCNRDIIGKADEPVHQQQDQSPCWCSRGFGSPDGGTGGTQGRCQG